LGMLCHDVPLNPVRAGITTVEKLPRYWYSSYWYLSRPKRRLDCLRMEAALVSAGGLPDTAAGWRRSADYLARQGQRRGRQGKRALMLR
jgi:hypothetical protein